MKVVQSKGFFSDWLGFVNEELKNNWNLDMLPFLLNLQEIYRPLVLYGDLHNALACFASLTICSCTMNMDRTVLTGCRARSSSSRLRRTGSAPVATLPRPPR